MGKNYHYARVSSADQNETRQLLAIKAFGIPRERVFIDKRSGMDFKRPRYLALLEKLAPGDLLLVTSVDRLGRNYEEIREQWRLLTREKGVDIKALDMPLLDTRRDKNLLGVFISDLVLQILSYVANVERENIHKRQAEGIAAAKARGVRFGREPRPLPGNFPEILDLWRLKKMTTAQAALALNMPRSTFYKKAKKAGAS